MLRLKLYLVTVSQMFGVEFSEGAFGQIPRCRSLRCAHARSRLLCARHGTPILSRRELVADVFASVLILAQFFIEFDFEIDAHV